MAFEKGCCLLNLDGTGLFSLKKVIVPYCMKKVFKKTGEIIY